MADCVHGPRSFAYIEMSLLLAKLVYRYDMELVEEELDWEGRSHLHVMWWKPALRIKLRRHDMAPK